MTNWAVFNDEGCLESGCTESQAKERAATMVADGDQHAFAGEECHDHEGQPAANCELCDDDTAEDEE